MTRFARRGKDQQKKEEATKWNEMFQSNSNRNNNYSKDKNDNFKRRRDDDRINKNYNTGGNNYYNKKFDNEKLSDIVDKDIKAELDKLKDESMIIKKNLIYIWMFQSRKFKI